jgi:glycosyltransferase involved in cell wall biosynthesis
MVSKSATTPLVSVVIPAFHAGQYIGEAVASVLAQTFRAFELIVVDDGGGDSAAAVQAMTRDPRVHARTRVENGGASAARNDGWRTAQAGPFVAFLDADDRFHPRKLAAQVAFLEAHTDCAAVGALMEYIASDGTPLGRAGQPLASGDQERIARGELFPFQLSSLLVRREALAMVGGFDEALGRIGSEDLDLLARLAACGRIDCLPEILGSYRIHPDSAMARRRSEINRAAQFVRHRLAARRAGRDLSWAAFLESHRPTWTERRQDAVERCYRAAALWYGERRPIRAAACGVMAAALGPGYTLRRLYRQRIRAGSAPLTGVTR